MNQIRFNSFYLDPLLIRNSFILDSYEIIQGIGTKIAIQRLL